MKQRLTAFDGLRTLCFSVIIFWHALLPYSNRPRGLKADVTSEWVDIVVWSLRGLALKEFFLVAGFLAHASLLRRGEEGYLKHRLLRLGLPCLVAAAFYNALFLCQVAPLYGTTPWGLASALMERGSWYEVLSARHLWFIVDLLFLTVLVVALRGVAQRTLKSGWRERLHQAFAATIRHPAGLLLLALPTAAMIWAHEPRFPSSNLTQFAALPFYPLITMLGFHSLFFMAGWLLFSHPDLLPVIAGRWPVTLVLGCLLRAVYYRLVIEGPGPFWKIALAHGLDALAGWCVVLGLLGLFGRFMTVDRPLWRYLADSAYWCYLAHFLFMEQLQLALNGSGWPPVGQYLLVTAGTWLGLFVSYEFGVRYTFVGTALHGVRRRPPQGRWSALSLASS